LFIAAPNSVAEWDTYGSCSIIQAGISTTSCICLEPHPPYCKYPNGRGPRFEDLPAQSEVVSVSARVPGALDGYFNLPHSLINGVLPGSIPYGRHMKSSNKVCKVCLPNIIEVRVWNILTTASCSLQTYPDANKCTQTL